MDIKSERQTQGRLLPWDWICHLTTDRKSSALELSDSYCHIRTPVLEQCSTPMGSHVNHSALMQVVSCGTQFTTKVQRLTYFQSHTPARSQGKPVFRLTHTHTHARSHTLWRNTKGLSAQSWSRHTQFPPTANLFIFAPVSQLRPA